MERAIQTILLMGRPGSGKGTQAKLLAEKFGWTSFSSGGRFKEFREGNSPISTRVREMYDAGKIAPDWFATYIFEDAFLNLQEAEGVMCEGYARTLSQARIFDETLAWLERPYVVFNLDVSEDESIKRQLSRASLEDRPDSGTEEQARARLTQYDQLTEPALAYFKEKGALITIDGTPSVETIQADIVSHLS